MHSFNSTRRRLLTRRVYYHTLINGPLSLHNGYVTLHNSRYGMHQSLWSRWYPRERQREPTTSTHGYVLLSGNLDLNMSCKYLHKRPSYIQVSNTRRLCVGSQKASTKLAGNSPVRPVRCCIPLYHPSSRFFCTYIMSPTRSSSSNSLLGGYGTIQRNLYPTLKLNTVIMKWWRILWNDTSCD